MTLKVLIIACLLILSSCGKPNNEPMINEFLEIQKTVYVTESGSNYYLDNCKILSKSRYPMSVRDAKLLYSPCSACAPPRWSQPVQRSNPHPLRLTDLSQYQAFHPRHQRQNGRCPRARHAHPRAVPLDLGRLRLRFGSVSSSLRCKWINTLAKCGVGQVRDISKN